MNASRRKFLKLALHGAVLIGVGNSLQYFNPADFKLPKRKDIKLRFIVASDGHFGQKDTDTEAKHNEMIDWINAEKTTRGLDLVIINGDLFHDDIALLPVVKSYWDKLTVPYFVSHGNHDKAPESVWESTWGNKWDFGFEKKDAAFIILNTCDENGKYICPDMATAAKLFSQYKNHPQLFVFSHITPIKWTGGAVDCPEMVSLINGQANVKAVFHGHDHDEDSVKIHEGVHYFFDSHIAGSWGTEYRGYRVVEVLKNGNVLTYQMNPAKKQQVNNNSI
jgi:3',5'-cyclic AMP phosphodiesterase CpdA